MHSGAVWFEIYVEDMDRARRFYEGVLHVKLEKLPSQVPELWAFPRVQEGPAISGALAKMPGLPVGRNSTIVYFGCKDCAIEAARVVKSGGRIQKEKSSIGQHGFIALAYDTEGNIFGLHSMD